MRLSCRPTAKEHSLDAIAWFLAEKGIEKGAESAKKILLGDKAKREVEECIKRSVARTVVPYSDDPVLQQHLETMLIDFIRQGGLDLFFLPDAAGVPDEELLREEFIDLGNDPDTLPEDFAGIVRRAAAAFTSEIGEAAQRDGSPLFNVVSMRTVEEIQAKLNELLQAVDSLIDPSLAEETWADLQSIGDDVRAVRADMEDLRRGRRRSGRVPNAKALLDGPIRALRLQGELNAADRLADRLQAAEAYGRIAARFSEEGYEVHARLLRHKRAEALADGGLTEEAFRIWLDDARAELETGRLWISPAVARGIDTHRDNMPSSLQARADALEALEGWYEQSVISIRILTRALEALLAEEDPAAKEVAVWLGEALAVDGTAEGLSLGSLIPQIEPLATNRDDSTSVRLRLLVAETTGEWSSLMEEVSTDALSSANAALVLCRYGRWLALHGKAEEAISVYR